MNIGFLLGSHPGLSLAELETLLPDAKWLDIQPTVAWAEVDNFDVAALQLRLGGTIKIVEKVMRVDGKPSAEAIMSKVKPSGERKFVFGFSLYEKANKRAWDKLGIDLKKAWKAEGFSVRYITTREPVLSTIVVVKEKLLKGGAELCLLPSKEGNVLGRTIASQDPRGFAKRDYGKAKRPTRVGMLPVKLAKIMINLADQPLDARILDPFVGSGTLLMELLVDGYDAKNIAGSDLAKRGVDHTEENIRAAGLSLPELRKLDAQNLHDAHKPNSFDAIVTEGHLGLPQNDKDRQKYKNEMEELYRNVLASYAKILKPGGKVVMAFPAYVLDDKNLLSLNLAETIKKHGFVPHTFTTVAPFQVQTKRKSLEYGRPSQRVKRDIYVLHFRP